MSVRTKAAAWIVALAAVAAACTTASDQPREGGTATGFLLEPTTLNPVSCGDVTCTEVIQRLFDSLTAYDPTTAQVIPGAAESWDVSDDGTVLTFQLRAGATFHNGDPVTAEDFVRGLTTAALKETASPVAGQLDGVKGFAPAQRGASDTLTGVHQGADELELVIELSQPNPEFLLRTGHTIFSPIPAGALEAPDDFRESPIGNGPYQMEGTWQHNESITVTRFEGYTGDSPGFLDGVTWRIFTDVETAFLVFQDGGLDATVVPAEQYGEAEATYGEAFVDLATAGNQFLAANTTALPTSDPNFRRAISLAINREDIIDSVFDGQQIPATSIIPPATPGHQSQPCRLCQFDVEEARRFLDLAGGPPDQPIVFTWVGAGTHDKWVEAVQQQLEQNLGIESRKVIHATGAEIVGFITGVDPVTQKQVRPKLEGGFVVIGWAQDYPTPDNWLFPTLHSEQDGLFTGYSNEEYDELISRAQGTVDPAERLRLQHQAEDIALDELPAIPMWYERTGLVYETGKIDSFVVDVQQGFPAWERITLS